MAETVLSVFQSAFYITVLDLHSYISQLNEVGKPPPSPSPSLRRFLKQDFNSICLFSSDTWGTVG